jgi:hypothetical protein
MLLSIALALQSAAPPPACESPEHRQFDFWVGSWDVYRTDTDQLVAHSLIEKLYGGCAVRENWIPINGFGAGGSLNSYRPEEKRWRQVYTGAGNGWADYAGGMDGGAMVIVGTKVMPNGSKTPVRITYEPKDGGVVQTGYQSADGGKTWALTYQFAYRPAGSSSK